jgi:lipopolysaccharide export system protein LptA
MRRYSLVLAAAFLLITLAVAYTLHLRMERARRLRPVPTPPVRTGVEGVANSGWQWKKDDPQTNRPVVRVDADSFEGTKDPSTFALTRVRLRLYKKDGSSYTFIRADEALFDEGSGVLKSDGPVYIVMNVPPDKNAEDPAEANKRVRVTTSGVTYETKTGKARTDKPASFLFTEGNGQGVGADYDPNTRVLHIKAQVALNWLGKGTAQNAMHIETSDLVYKEAENKIYLSPWSRLKRQTMTLDAQNSVVMLDDGRLHEVDGDRPRGIDTRDDRTTQYSADRMRALFDEDGNLVQILGEGNAHVTSAQPAAKTSLTGDRADLRFALQPEVRNNEQVMDSQLHLVMADGHGIAQSTPVPRPGVQLPESRTLRSEHIELEMKPGGKDLKEIRTSAQAQLEFTPNRPDQSHRVVDASHLRVLYGEGSYVDRLLAWNVMTHTNRPAGTAKPQKGPDGKPLPPAPAVTWSDEMIASFTPGTNQVGTVDQSGNFRYEEGTRKANAKKAFLEQTINRITLTGAAKVMDDTGSAAADTIVMNQANGDMDAQGHVLSTHEPDKQQKPGTSMLDDAQPMQAQADAMQTRDNNSKVFYEGHAVMWQGANRISADQIRVDRDTQSLAASGNVVSELVDNRDEQQPASGETVAAAAGTGPIYTVVHAPELTYRDDTRIALYTGGVKLVRDKTTITAKQIQAFLTPKSEKASDQSSLHHAFATGDVNINEVISPGRTRVGTAERCEYYTGENKVVLNGGLPRMVDSRKGITKGEQLTYFSDDDHLIVDGKKNQGAFTQLKKR